MPHRNELGLEWWRHTVEIVPFAAALVSADNRFLFANKAWCELVERSEADLRDKTWVEITASEDIGDDARESEALKRGDKLDYYDSKSYVMPSGARKPVGIWVNRHPHFGDFKGYVVFARIRDHGASAAEVQRLFETVRGQIAILEEQAKAFRALETRLDVQEALAKQQSVDLNRRFDRLEAAINRPQASVSVGGDYAGHDSQRNHIASTNSNIAIIALAVLGAVVLAVLFGGAFHLVGGGRAVIEQPLPIGGGR
jgi:PAS domain S-box-containing protein